MEENNDILKEEIIENKEEETIENKEEEIIKENKKEIKKKILKNKDNFNYYVVKEKDNIEEIAEKYNIGWKELYARNKFIIGNNPKNLKKGQILKIR